MAARGFAFLLLGLLAGGCVQSTLEMSSDANLTPRDKKLLAKRAVRKGHNSGAVQAPHRQLSPQGNGRRDRGR
jgi:hypothetical protein